MATYFLVNSLFLIAVAFIFRLKPRKLSTRTMIVLTALLILTALFDSILVGLGIVAYDPSLISGINIGSAPIEDFFYAILAVMIVPKLWKMTEGTHDRNN